MADEPKPLSEQLTAEQKPLLEAALKQARDAAAAETKTQLEEARKKAVPAKYELKFADNSPLAADQERIAAFARERGLSQEDAAKLVAHTQEVVDGVLGRQKASLPELAKKWEADTKADKDLGGDKYPATQANVRRVMDAFAEANPESSLGKLLNESGYGNHPEWIRLVNWIGKAMGEDGGLKKLPGDKKPDRKNTADVLYGNKAS